jgi:CHAT domain-containing protein
LFGLLLIFETHTAISEEHLNRNTILLAQSSQNTPVLEAAQLYQQGDQLFQQGTNESLRQAIQVWEQARQLSQAERNQKLEAAILHSTGSIYYRLHLWQQAFDHYRQALILWRKEGLRAEEANTLYWIGSIYRGQGHPQQALVYYEQALSLKQEINNPELESQILTAAGSAHADLQEWQPALDYFRQALPLWRIQGNWADVITTLRYIGEFHLSLGQYQSSLYYYKEALELSQEKQYWTGQADVLQDIAKLYTAKGEYQQALEYHDQTLKLCQEKGDWEQEARVLNNIGNLYSTQGGFQQALNVYYEALNLLQENHRQNGQILYNTVLEIARAYHSMGDDRRAIYYYLQLLPGLDIKEDIERIDNLEIIQFYAAVFKDMGDIYSTKDYQQALDSYDLALRGARTSQDQIIEATVLNSIANLYSNQKNYRQALEYYSQELHISQALEDRSVEAIALEGIGNVYLEQGDDKQALDYYKRSLYAWQLANNPAYQFITLHKIASIYYKQEKFEEALAKLDAAINIIEGYRVKFTGDDLRTSYFASVQHIYQLKCDILMQLGRDVEAFDTNESARARTLLELLTESKTDIRKNVAPKLVEQEHDLITQQEAQYNLLNTVQTESARRTIQTKLGEIFRELETLKIEIRRTSPAYANLKYPTPLTATEIQQQVLDDDTLLLKYSLGEKQSYLWIVPKQGTIASYPLHNRKDIETAAKTFKNIISNLSCEPNNPEPCVPLQAIRDGKALTSLILPPAAAQQIAGKKRLLIVGDGELQLIPFAALPDPNAPDDPTIPPEADYVPLVMAHEIINAPSASTIATLRQQMQQERQANQRPAQKAIAIIADPVFGTDDDRFQASHSLPSATQASAESAIESLPLSSQLDLSALESAQRSTTNTPFDSPVPLIPRLGKTEETAKQILKLVPDAAQKTAVFGFDANQDWVTGDRSHLSQYRQILFATHGIFDGQNPARSGIVLSLVDQQGKPRDGYLRLNEIFNLNLAADLVVLSACKSGQGENIRGEGLVGITRGFMYAGAERIVASLWNIDAGDPTDNFLTAYFQKMLSQSDAIAPTAAFHETQKEMFQKYKDPYYWAAFTLQGEWQ